MKFKSFVFFCAVLLIFSAISFSQSKETGAIVGTVMDEEDTPLPGVTVTLTSPQLMGARTAISDANGQYRFPALPPGMYTVKAELQGFTTVVQENIRLTTTLRLTVDLVLKVTTLEEEVTVIAQSPTVDVKTSETASVTLADEILRNIPNTQFVTDIVNLAPGVDQDVAYGASDSTGISYQVDGVDVSDPELGSAWVFLDYNILEEVKIMGIGLPAEYGAFTGVIFNTITKSGGNEFSGHAEFIFQDTKKGFWTAENNKEYIDDFPSLESPVEGLMDVSFHLGGPIQKDKVWFFTGGQYYRSKSRPAGFQAPNFRDYKQPRAFFKLTSQPSSKFNLTLFYEFDAYNGINRRASSSHPTPETCVDQTSPDHVGNFDLTYILSPTTFVDLKGSFFIGYYYLDPQGEGTAWYVKADKRWYYNSNWEYKADRKRYQANGSVSHYAEDFIQGNHDFKFGTEFEYGWARSRFSYTGNVEGIGSNVWIYDWWGYLYAYQYEGYDIDSNYIRNEYFVQDAWSITDNLTLNFGGRFSILRGYTKGVSGAVYSTERIAPRVGFAFDIFGDHSTVLKAHYGHFTEAIFTSVFDRLNPPSAYKDYVIYSEYGGNWYEIYREVHEEIQLAENIKHPYLEQFTLGVERELFRDASLGVSFIYRNWKNMLGVYDTLGEYEKITVQDPLTTETYQLYDMINAGQYNRVIANFKEGDPWILKEPYRKYWGIEVLFNKRMSNRWQMLMSYIYSKCTGTMDNDFGADVGWGGKTYDPNFWLNSEGHATRDPTHMLKVQGSYILPFGVHFNAHFRYITGNTWTRTAWYWLSQGGTTILTEDRGSRRYPDRKFLDLRLEKTFTIADKYRIGVMMDVFNVFNEDTVTSWGTEAGYDWTPGDPGPDGHTVYDLVDPRAVRLGIRLFF
jgi:hypothetical protein